MEVKPVVDDHFPTFIQDMFQYDENNLMVAASKITVT
jgi:hypothetical protein